MHAAGLGQRLLDATGLQTLGAAAIDHGDLFRAQPLGLDRDIHRRHAAADHDDAAADGKFGFVRGLTQFGDIVDGIDHAVQFLALESQPVDAAQPQAQEHRVMALGQLVEVQTPVQFRAQACAAAHFDAADTQDVRDFPLREFVRRLVGGEAVFVEPAELVFRLEDGDLVAVTGQPVRAGQPGRPAADDGDFLAGRRCPHEFLLAAAHQGVSGEALQQADPDRLVLGPVAHAGRLAQGFGRADPGAHAADDVLLEDGVGRPLGVPGRDLADEQRHVDARRAGVHAGRVVAEIAALRLDQRLVRAERRMDIGKIDADLFRRQTPAATPAIRCLSISSTTSLSGSRACASFASQIFTI